MQALESSGAHHTAAASHKASNAWYKAFHAIYGGVASDCSVPTGKNRYHKFKDKIVELWNAVEQADESYTSALRETAVRQLVTYREALDTKSSASLEEGMGGKGINGLGAKGDSKDKRVGSGEKAVGGGKAGSNKRPHQTTSSSKYPPPFQTWAHLDEAAALERLPQPLRTLLNLRHMGVEVQSQDTVLVEEAYSKALDEFLQNPTLADNSGKVAEEKAEETEEPGTDAPPKPAKKPEDLYALCQSMVVLWRCSRRLQKAADAKAILYTYHNIVQEYLQAIQQQEQMKCILCKLIGAIGTRQHPIVIFLDGKIAFCVGMYDVHVFRNLLSSTFPPCLDLQWADKTSLDVIKMITVSPDISHCFFLACYRDNDSAMAKPVETMLDGL